MAQDESPRQTSCTILGYAVASLGQSWDLFKPSQAILGTSWPNLPNVGAILGPLWAILDCLRPSQGYLESSWGHLGAKLIFRNLCPDLPARVDRPLGPFRGPKLGSFQVIFLGRFLGQVFCYFPDHVWGHVGVIFC